MLFYIFLNFIIQVWCGTTTGEILQIHIGSGLISTTEWSHNHIVSGIHLDLKDNEQPIMYTTSMDATIKVEKRELNVDVWLE